MDNNGIIKVPKGGTCMLYSDELIKRLQTSIKKGLYEIHKSKKVANEIYDFLEEHIHSPFNDFQSLFFEHIDPNDKGSFETVNMLIHDYEVYWDFLNGLTFYCDLDKNKFTVDKLKKDYMISALNKLLNNFDTECTIVNAKKGSYKSFILRLSKSDFKLGLKRQGELYDTYCFTVSIQSDNGVDKSMSAYLVPELYPKVFIDKNYTRLIDKDTHDMLSDSCSEVEMIISSSRLRNIHNKMLEEIGRGTNETQVIEIFDSNAFLLLPFGVRNNDDYSGDIFKETGIHFEELLSICFYCIDKYVNRKKVYKKGSTKSDCGVSTKVYIPNEGIKETRLVSLQDMVVYEREHKVSLGGHHASPREHIRRGYWRHYKSGKTVWIESTTVNKGVKKKTYYKV